MRSGKYRALQEDPEPIVYFPLSQSDPVLMHLLARTTAGAGSLLAQLPSQLLTVGRANVLWTTTFGDYLAHELIIDRVITMVVAACGLLALLLSTIGVSGMISAYKARASHQPHDRASRGIGAWKDLIGAKPRSSRQGHVVANDTRGGQEVTVEFWQRGGAHAEGRCGGARAPIHFLISFF